MMWFLHCCVIHYTHTHTPRISASVFPDVDECSNEPDLCAPHGKCLNTEGSYQCVCDSGFTANLETPTCDGKMKYKLHTLFHSVGYCIICIWHNFEVEKNVGGYYFYCLVPELGHSKALDLLGVR